MTQSDTELPRFYRHTFLVFGALVGLAIYALIEHADGALYTDRWPFSLVFGMSVGAAAAVFAVRPRYVRATALLALLLALISTGLSVLKITLLTGPEDGDPGPGFFFELVVPLVALAYIATVYFQSWCDTGDFSFPYARLFHHSWTGAQIGLISLVFLGLGWGVLAIWSGLFSLISIDFFEDIFFESEFAWPFSIGILALGVALGRESPRLTGALRWFFLLIFQYLAPVLGLAMLIFIIALPLQGLSVLSEMEEATLLFISLIFLFVVFINAVVQDEQAKRPFPKLIHLGIALVFVCLPLFAAIAWWGIGIRIAEYGLSPQRFLALAIILVTSLYALAYAAAAVLGRQNWPAWVCKFNPGLAIAGCIIGLLINVPGLDGYNWSARTQSLALLAMEDPAEFDFGALKFRTAKPGRDALAQIRTSEKFIHKAGMKESLARLDLADSYWGWRAGAKDEPGDLVDLQQAIGRIQTFPADLDIPAGVLKTLKRDRESSLRTCLESPCYLFAKDLNEDGQTEFLLWPYAYKDSVIMLKRSGANWSDWMVSEHWRERGTIDPDAVERALKNGDISLIESRVKGLKIGPLEIPAEAISRYLQ